jgi:hypothetical protein
MDDRDDKEHLGSFVPHTFEPPLKIEILRDQNAFSVRGVNVEGIHTQVMY